jgi:hypothetical protein
MEEIWKKIRTSRKTVHEPQNPPMAGVCAEFTQGLQGESKVCVAHLPQALHSRPRGVALGPHWHSIVMLK